MRMASGSIRMEIHVSVNKGFKTKEESVKASTVKTRYSGSSGRSNSGWSDSDDDSDDSDDRDTRPVQTGSNATPDKRRFPINRIPPDQPDNQVKPDTPDQSGIPDQPDTPDKSDTPDKLDTQTVSRHPG